MRGQERAQAVIDLLALRTLIIDAHLRDAIAAGAQQVVILGAGLDGRAYRMTELAAVPVFEVDHPVTQAWKRERATALTATARAVTFVPIDFERDALGAALIVARHQANLPTAWIWEGVVMYLTDQALHVTLQAVAACSAPGSTLIVNYMEPYRRPLLLRVLLWVWGEPHIGMRSAESMAHTLVAHGFRVETDSGVQEWAKRFGVGQLPDDLTPRLAVAKR